MVNLPDMVESSNSKRGRRAIEGQSSPVRGGGTERLQWSGKSVVPPGAALRWSGKSVMRPRAAPRGSGAPGPADGETRGADKMHRVGPFYSHALHGGNTGLRKERERGR
jgi:hypothetical protein